MDDTDRRLMAAIFGEDTVEPERVYPPGVAYIATGYWYDGWDFQLKYTVLLHDTTTNGYWRALIRKDGYASGPWRFTWSSIAPDEPGTQQYTDDYDELPLPVRDEIARYMELLASPYVPY